MKKQTKLPWQFEVKEAINPRLKILKRNIENEVNSFFCILEKVIPFLI